MRAIALSIALSISFVRCTEDLQHSTTESSASDESAVQVSETSEITCPECGHKKVETLPTDVCAIKYTCENCKAELTPKDGDCCVYCTYGTHKCPSMQEE